MSLKREPAASAFLRVLVVCAMVVWIVPTLGLLINSLRPERDALATGWWTVFNSPLRITRHTIESYSRGARAQEVGAAFRNSLAIAAVCTLLPVIMAAFAAFGFSHLSSGKRTVFFAAIAGLAAVPLCMTFSPVLRTYSRLGLSGSLVGLWLAHAGYGLPFQVFLFYNLYSILPEDLFESVHIDGASTITAFLRVALPLSVPALASLVIFQFIWIWNDLLVALIYLGGANDVALLTTRLSGLVGSHGQSWPLIVSASFISIMVPLVVFLCLEKYLIRGILAGSIDG
jgi:alpha-glucoside transport system permease protein